MIVDSSAVMAVLRREPEAELFARVLDSRPCVMSVATWVELGLVAQRISPTGIDDCDDLIRRSSMTMRPVTIEHGRLAREAHRRYGRGSGSRAKLNYGDCFAYALAMQTGEPLLFKGDDFIHTDVTPAL